jgi:hypothetical protein
LEFFNVKATESLAKGETAAYAGRGGGRKLANDLFANLEDEGEVSLLRLQTQILSQD